MGMHEYNQSIVFLPIFSAQRLFDLADKFSYIEITVNKQKTCRKVKNRKFKFKLIVTAVTDHVISLFKHKELFTTNNVKNDLFSNRCWD